MLCACGWGGKGQVNVFGVQTEVCCVSCRRSTPPPGVAGYELLAQGAAAVGMPGSAPRSSELLQMVGRDHADPRALYCPLLKLASQ